MGAGVDPEAFLRRDIAEIERLIAGARRHLAGKTPWRAITWYGDAMEILGMARRTAGEFQPVEGTGRVDQLQMELLTLHDEVVRFCGGDPELDELDQALTEGETTVAEIKTRLAGFDPYAAYRKPNG